jgi:hypothetical protein
MNLRGLSTWKLAVMAASAALTVCVACAIAVLIFGLMLADKNEKSAMTSTAEAGTALAAAQTETPGAAVAATAAASEAASTPTAAAGASAEVDATVQAAVAATLAAHEAAVTPEQPFSTWHVATDGSDSTGDGSEANPFATIQHGIDVASQGDTVLAHPGVYKENINFLGKNITVGSLFVTTGDEDYIMQTVIDGTRQDHVVTFENGETAEASLSGFTITNGYSSGTPWPESSGGGVYCIHADPTLVHLRVSDNEATDEGGGLYFDTCSPIIEDVVVTNNLAGAGGGGMRFSSGSPILQNVVVTGNSASSGGGLFFYHAEATVTNALVADNVADNRSGDGGGGGLYFDGCNPIFVNVTVVGNSTLGDGGGLHISYLSNPTLVNSIVWGNSPEQIYFDMDWEGEAVTIEYSDIQGGEAGIVTNDQGPVYWGDGNMDANPQFVNADPDRYRLADDSPCLNAGKAAGAPPTDIEGNPRPDPPGSNPDMGAYENP